MAASALPRPADRAAEFVCTVHQTTHHWSSASAVCRGHWRYPTDMKG